MKGIINQNVFDFKSYFPKLEMFSENGFRKILLNLISIRIVVKCASKICVDLPKMIIYGMHYVHIGPPWLDYSEDLHKICVNHSIREHFYEVKI